MRNTKISVIVPTYNRVKSLQVAIGCLINQTLDSNLYEVIIVDDGSHDTTLYTLKELMLRHHQLKYIFQANKGPAAARNTGLKAARGRIVAFTDDDCEVAQDWLETILKSFNEDKRLVGLQGSTYTTKSEVTPLTHQVENLEGNHAIPTCNAAYRKDAILKINGFDCKFPYPHNEDTDVAWRIAPLGRVKFNKDMKVHHPPRKDSFKKVASRMKVLTSEFALYYKNKSDYKKFRGGTPWKTIYKTVFVKNNVHHLKQGLKNWKNPKLMLTGVLIVFSWWIDMLVRLPEYLKADRYYAEVYCAEE